MLLPSLSDLTATSNRLAPLLFDACLRGTIILALAGLTTAALRRASAAARHCIWFLAVFCLLLIPILSAALPTWNILPPAARAIVPAKALSTTPPPSAAPLSPPLENNLPIASSTPISLLPQMPQLSSTQKTLPASADFSPKPHTSLSANNPTPPWTFWLMLLWLLGASLILLHILLGHLSLALLQRHCTRLHTEESATQITRLQKQLSLRRSIILLTSPRRTMPMTWGIFRPRILLPAEANTWNVEKRDAVLLHELAHIRRHDCAAQLIAQLVCALYWFHPLVWIAWNRMQLERERACDDLVLNTGTRPSAYAHHLLKSAAAMPTLPFVSAAAAMARPSTLEERLRAILDPQRNRSTMNIKTTSAAVMLVLAALVPVAVLHAQEDNVPLRSTASQSPRPAPASRPAGFTGGGSARFPGGADQPTSDINGPACSFDAEIYEVHLPSDQMGNLNVDDFSNTTTTADFKKALERIGTSQILYRANQSVRLSKDRIAISTQIPVITNSREGPSGPINTVSYQNVGAIFNIEGKAFPNAGVNLNLDIQMSSVSDGGTPISATVKAQVFRTATLSFKGMAQPNKPFYIVSFDAATRDDKDQGVAYIVRATLGTPQSPPAAAPAKPE